MILGMSLDSGEPIPAGRDAALKGMLSRGRDGQMTVPVKAIIDHADAPEAVVGEAVASMCGEPALSVSSDKLPAILAEVDRRMNRPVELDPEDASAGEEAPKEPPAEGGEADAPAPVQPAPQPGTAPATKPAAQREPK